VKHYIYVGETAKTIGMGALTNDLRKKFVTLGSWHSGIKLPGVSALNY
jgi:hypothetical protein